MAEVLMDLQPDATKSAPQGVSSSLAGAGDQTSSPHASRTVLLLGPEESGKTVIALQDLIAAVKAGERGIFVSFDEPPASIREKAAAFGWDLPLLEKQRRLVLHARVRPQIARAGHFAVEAVLSALTSEIRALRMGRVVLDGVHVMLSLLETRQARLHAALRLRDWIHENELSAVLTYCARPAEQSDAAACGPEVIECLADCVVALHVGSRGRGGRHLRFVRYRCAELPTIKYPIRITGKGVVVVKPDTKHGPGSLRPRTSSELARSRRLLSAGLRQLHCFLEAKQAEFDLLLEKGSAAAHVESESCAADHVRDGSPA